MGGDGFMDCMVEWIMHGGGGVELRVYKLTNYLAIHASLVAHPLTTKHKYEFFRDLVSYYINIMCFKLIIFLS
jgi:hypothetical protein